MDLRSSACFALSRRLMRPAPQRQTDYGAYDAWREASLARSWSAFSDGHIRGRDVLDFGCGDGQLARLLAGRGPRRIVGVDLNEQAISRARLAGGGVEYIVGREEGVPVPDHSFDTIVAFDCMEHVMCPQAILDDWHRVLRPGGRALIEWYPFHGPWGPHMESLIPIPWAHRLFGERAMFQAAARLYDDHNFQPRHWDLDEHGRKKQNKWRQWTSFREQGYVNQLTVDEFTRMVDKAGFRIGRLERRSFGGSGWRRSIGATLMRLVPGDTFVSHVIVELVA